jgi:beta-galactosidase
LICGSIQGVYPTVDFGPGHNVNRSFEEQREYALKGALVNSEYYLGWIDHWGKPHSKKNITEILNPFVEMMKLNANINLYMFHGGTNFGFSNGKNKIIFMLLENKSI